jgi:1-phosphatidylinositol-3-phosphate 5-kinase
MKCSDEFVSYLSRCVPWRATGGKSGASFMKTSDERYVIKQLSKPEMDAFLKFAKVYFEYVSKAYLTNVN